MKNIWSMVAVGLLFSSTAFGEGLDTMRSYAAPRAASDAVADSTQIEQPITRGNADADSTAKQTAIPRQRESAGCYGQSAAFCKDCN